MIASRLASVFGRVTGTGSMEDSLRARVLGGAAWSLAAAVVSRGANLLAGILAARLLGQRAFGELGMVQNTIGMLGTFAGLGLGLTATKFLAELRDRDAARGAGILALSTRMSVLSGGIMALLLLLAAPLLASRFLAAPELVPALRLGAGLLFLGAIQGAQNGALSGLEAFRSVAMVNLATGVATLPAVVAGAWWAGLEGAVAGSVAALAVNCVANEVALRRACARFGIVPAGARWRAELPILWSFALPALLSSVVSMPIFWACNALLVNRPGGYDEMGVLNAAGQWRNLLLFIPTVLGQLITPILAERYGQGSTRSAAGALRLAMAVAALTAVPAAAMLAVGSPWIMAVYGESFVSGWPTLVVVLATSALLAVQTPVGGVIAASGRMWLGTAMNLGWGLVLLAATLALLDAGALGIALANLIAYTVHGGWTFWFARKVLAGDQGE